MGDQDILYPLLQNSWRGEEEAGGRPQAQKGLSVMPVKTAFADHN